MSMCLQEDLPELEDPDDATSRIQEEIAFAHGGQAGACEDVVAAFDDALVEVITVVGDRREEFVRAAFDKPLVHVVAHRQSRLTYPRRIPLEEAESLLSSGVCVRSHYILALI